MPTVRKQVGESLRRHRKQRGISQVQLAERARVSFDAISRAERNQTTPSLEVLERLAAVLRVPLWALIGGGDVTPTYSADTTAVAEILERLSPQRRRRIKKAMLLLLTE